MVVLLVAVDLLRFQLQFSGWSSFHPLNLSSIPLSMDVGDTDDDVRENVVVHDTHNNTVVDNSMDCTVVDDDVVKRLVVALLLLVLLLLLLLMLPLEQEQKLTILTLVLMVLVAVVSFEVVLVLALYVHPTLLPNAIVASSVVMISFQW